MVPTPIAPDDPGDHGKSGGAVGGGLTDAELRATPVDVTVIGEVEVKNDSGNAIPTNVLYEAYGDMRHGQNNDVDSGASEQIVGASNFANKGVLVKAFSTNTGIIYIGNSGVTVANGVPLLPGESITIPQDDANKVYVIASIDNQQLAWMTV